MSGIRSFLIGIANLILLLLIVVVPIIAFIAGGAVMGMGQFDVLFGILSAITAFVLMLPSAALLAVFLDIREQLVTVSHNTAGGLPGQRAGTGFGR